MIKRPGFWESVAADAGWGCLYAVGIAIVGNLLVRWLAGGDEGGGPELTKSMIDGRVVPGAVFHQPGVTTVRQ